MIKKSVLTGTILFLIAALALMTLPALAMPQQGQLYYYTPTADQNGRIVYIVKANDGCLSISLLTGISIDDLRALNNLDENCTIIEGQELLLGVVKESTPTPGPTPTATPILPSPTPFNGYAEVCIALFEDTNGNAVRDGEEDSLTGGAVSISDSLGKFSKTLKLEGSEEEKADCFLEVPEGKYSISVAIPEGYNPTTEMIYELDVKAGDQMLVNFGAQPNAIMPTESTENGNQRSPMLAIAGGLMLIGGAGLAIYFWLARRNSSSVP